MSSLEDNPFLDHLGHASEPNDHHPGNSDNIDHQPNGDTDRNVDSHADDQVSVSTKSPRLPYPMLSAEPKTIFCCSIDRYLHGDDWRISITNAEKTNDGGSSFISYLIRTNLSNVKRRYREFESLRHSIVKLYPTIIIPPIPSKHSIGDYATKQGKAKEDVHIIDTRKRMLQVFLNRVAKHPVLKNEHVFHQFLENGVSWNEVLHSPPLATIPKNILKASSSNPADQNAPQTNLPIPNASHNLRDPDPRFLESEKFTNRFSNHLSGTMERVNRRVVKRLNDLSHDYAELGAVYNGFSLQENGDLANAIEKIGAAIDHSHTATNQLISTLDTDVTEPLGEYTQFSNVIKQVLKYRHMKHLQYEMTQETLETKRIQLENLEQSEEEARRLAAALDKISIGHGTGHSRTHTNSSISPGVSREGSSDQGQSQGDDNLTNVGDDSLEGRTDSKGQDPLTSATTSPSNMSSSSMTISAHKRGSKGFGGSKFLGALSHTFQGIMDVDPEATRRNNIGKTRDMITQLDEALKAATKDIKFASQSIQTDLDRFQRQKVADIRDMLMAYAKAHIAWCESNLSAWEEAKSEVEKIKI